MSVVIKAHDPAWITEFDKNKKILEDVLADVPYTSIEHVGSTSVPGLYAKPVLDILIVIKAQNLSVASDALSNAGYIPLGELGVPGRYVFRQPGYQVAEQADGQPGHEGEMRRNTYVGIEGCLAVRNHLNARDVLKADEGLRREYGDVKRRLVGGGGEVGVGHVDAYTTGKSEVIGKILRKAGWSGEDLEALGVSK